MALPKNFNQNNKRVESLNNLSYYTVDYDYVLTDLEGFNQDQIDVINYEINGVKKFTALNDDVADRKINEWFESLVRQNIVKSYSINNKDTTTFYDKLVESKLMDMLEYNK